MGADGKIHAAAAKQLLIRAARPPADSPRTLVVDERILITLGDGLPYKV